MVLSGNHQKTSEEGMKLALNACIAFGLAFDVEKSGMRPSRFRPADTDLGSGKKLFGDLRLKGLAAMLRLGFTKKLIVVGGNEGRYAGDMPVINRAEVIKLMLERDFNIDGNLIEAIPSASNTLGNVAIIKDNIGDRPHRSCAVVSNLYHLPRAGLDLVGAGLGVPMFAAEAFLLVEGNYQRGDILEKLGGGPLAERMVEEIQGIADKLTGKYVSKTDIPVR